MAQGIERLLKGPSSTSKNGGDDQEGAHRVDMARLRKPHETGIRRSLQTQKGKLGGRERFASGSGEHTRKSGPLPGKARKDDKKLIKTKYADYC